jgi:hypothetical protein
VNAGRDSGFLKLSIPLERAVPGEEDNKKMGPARLLYLKAGVRFLKKVFFLLLYHIFLKKSSWLRPGGYKENKVRMTMTIESI